MSQLFPCANPRDPTRNSHKEFWYQCFELKKNYWKAGTSGKNTVLATKAGVIGTFGIGGMANLGVCTRIRIETESIENNERVISEVERKNLSLSEECISIDKTDARAHVEKF